MKVFFLPFLGTLAVTLAARAELSRAAQILASIVSFEFFQPFVGISMIASGAVFMLSGRQRPALSLLAVKLASRLNKSVAIPFLGVVLGWLAGVTMGEVIFGSSNAFWKTAVVASVIASYAASPWYYLHVASQVAISRQETTAGNTARFSWVPPAGLVSLLVGGYFVWHWFTAA